MERLGPGRGCACADSTLRDAKTLEMLRSTVLAAGNLSVNGGQSGRWGDSGILRLVCNSTMKSGELVALYPVSFVHLTDQPSAEGVFTLLSFLLFFFSLLKEGFFLILLNSY